MTIRSRAILRPAALIAACSLWLSAVATPMAAQQPAAARKAAAVPKVPPIEGGWPKSYTTSNGARRILYQPQVADWKDEKRRTLYAAVSYTPAASQMQIGSTFRFW